MAIRKVYVVIILSWCGASGLAPGFGNVGLGHSLGKYKSLFNSVRLWNASSECGSKILHMVNHFLHDDNVLEAFMNSGKAINDLGSYEACAENNKNRYILLSINGLPLVFNFGICGPNECTLSDYEILKPPIADIVNELVKSITPPESELEYNVTANDVEFRDSLDENRLKTQMKWSTVVTFLLGLLIVGVSVTASLRNFLLPRSSAQLTQWDRALNCFDLLRNMQILGHSDPRQDKNLRVFNGMRVLAMFWIIFGHAVSVGQYMPSSNPEVLPNYLTEFSKAHIYNATLSVDVFFFLSGFLLCFIVLSSPGTRLNWKLYLHRLIRLYPALIAAYLVYVCILPYFGQGPRFPAIFDATQVDCPQLWHYVMFFIYNFRPWGTECMAWVWYLANDMQFFIITPLLLYLLLKRWRVGLLVVGVLLVGSYVSTFIIAYKYNVYASMSRYTRNWDKYYYDKPYTRISTYLLGLLFGYWYLQSKCEGTVSHSLAKALESTPVLRWIFYLLGINGCFFIVHVMYWLNKYPNDYARSLDAIYLVFNRSVFILSLCLLIAPALVGKGRFLHFLLSNNLMTVLSKLTYGVYLLHLIVADFFTGSAHIPFFARYDEFVFLFWIFALLGYLAAVAFFVFVEMPIFNLEDLLLKSRSHKPPLLPSEEQQVQALSAIVSKGQKKDEEVHSLVPSAQSP